MIGNALGDGSSAKKETNSTEEVKDERTFSQKYKDQLKKGADEIDEEDEDLGPGDDAPETEAGEEDDSKTDDSTPEGDKTDEKAAEEKPEAEADDDDTVSSKDMFDEM